MKDLDRMNDAQLDEALAAELAIAAGGPIVDVAPDNFDLDAAVRHMQQPFVDKTQELLNRMAAVQIEAAVRNMVDNMLMMQRAEAMNAAGVKYLDMQLQTGRGEVSYLALMASWGSPPATVH